MRLPSKQLVLLGAVSACFLLSACSGTVRTGSSSASPSTPASPARCQSTALQASGSWEGAGGSTAGGISVTNTGTSTCTLAGSPTAELYSQLGGALTVTSVTSTASSSVSLKPGGQTPYPIEFQWTNWCGSDPGVVTVQLSIPNVGTVMVDPPVGLIPHCNSATAPSTVELGGFLTAPLPSSSVGGGPGTIQPSPSN